MKAFKELKKCTKKDIIIEGLMKSTGVYLIVAAPKVGKSIFATQLADSIANGKPFLNYNILKPSPVLYVTTEVDGSQLDDRCNQLNITFDNENFFSIDKEEFPSMNFSDMELEIKSFAEDYPGGVLVLDMLKEIDFGINYDINSYQDVSQKIMPKIKKYVEKYKLTIIIVHHSNKVGKTLGSTGLDACVDGIIRLFECTYNKNTLKVQIDNRDFPFAEFYISRGEHGGFSISEDGCEDELHPYLVEVVKEVVKNRNFDTTLEELIQSPKLNCTPVQLGKLINNNKVLLAKTGVTFSSYRTSKDRMYHFEYHPPGFAENDNVARFVSEK